MPGGFHPSADVISAWPKANYIDPETKGNELLVVTIIFTTLSTAAVLARLWVRVKYQKEIRADDVMLVVCMVSTFLLTFYLRVVDVGTFQGRDTDAGFARFLRLELQRF